MEVIVSILLFLLGSVIIVLSIGLFLTFLSYERAIKNRPIGYKEGMVVDLKTNKLIGTKTPIYYDPKTGIRHLGETIQIKE